MTQVAVIHTAFEDTPRTVALVEAGDRTGDDALEYAYRWTQNIMDSWSKKMPQDGNDDVTVMAELPVSKRTGERMGLRSTSVGDQMLLGTKKYRVASFGFKEVDTETA
jgi:hypothetical protein